MPLLDPSQLTLLAELLSDIAKLGLTRQQVATYLAAVEVHEAYFDYVRNYPTGAEPLSFALWYTHRCVDDFTESFTRVSEQQAACDEVLLAMGLLKAADLP